MHHYQVNYKKKKEKNIKRKSKETSFSTQKWKIIEILLRRNHQFNPGEQNLIFADTFGIGMWHT